MLGALASFSTLAVCVREATTAGVHPFQILVIRCAFGALMVPLVVRLVDGHFARIRTRQPGLQVLRNIAHFGGQYGWITGISALPLAMVFSIEFTVPLWAAGLAVLFLGERLSRRRVLVMVMGFVGILIITQPWQDGALSPAVLAMLGCALGFATANICTKGLTRTDGPFAVLFWMSLLQLIFSAVPAWIVWSPIPLAQTWLVLGALSVCALSAHFCLTMALSKADATLIMPLDFLRLPVIAVVAYLLYQETPSETLALGAILILSGVSLTVYGESRRSAAQMGDPQLDTGRRRWRSHAASRSTKASTENAADPEIKRP